MVLKRTKIQLSVLISVFLMIYFSADTLLFGTNGNEGMKLIGYAGVLFLSLYWMIKGSISKKHLSLAIVLVCLGTLTMLTTGINIKYFYILLFLPQRIHYHHLKQANLLHLSYITSFSLRILYHKYHNIYLLL